MNEIELTQELVKIDSQNPPGNEKEVAKFVYDYLRDMGIQSELIEIGPNRFDVTAEIGKGEGLMFNGHMDTVPVGDAGKWKHDPFGGKIVKGKLYGRGSSDMKGGVACILAAVKRVAKENFKKRLVMTFVADEETGHTGSSYLIKNRKYLLAGVRYGVFAESTSMGVAYAQKGFLHAKAKFFGKAAHGSSPELGINAIEKAVKFVNELQKLKVSIGKIKDPVMNSGTLNIGKITGGTKVNIVPDYCEVELDRRLIANETPELALMQFKQALKKSKVDGKIESMSGRPPMKVSKNSQIIKLIQQLSGLKLNISAGYDEAELYKTYLGIECVSVGPGLHAQAHVVNEFVPIDNLKKSTDLYEGLIRKMCI